MSTTSRSVATSYQSFSELINEQLKVLGYAHWKSLDKNNELSPSKHLGIYLNKKNQKVVIRSILCANNTKESAQIKNEIRLLQLLELLAHRKKTVLGFPRLISIINQNQMTSMIRQYIPGKTLRKYPTTRKIKLLVQLLASLQQLSTVLAPQEKTLIKQKLPFLMLFEMPCYLLLAVSKNRDIAKALLNVCTTFFTYISLHDILQPHLELVYRDIHSQNIIVNDSKIFLIDSEVCVIGEKETDYAMAFILYCSEIPTRLLNNTLQLQLRDIYARRRYIKLVAFYTLQLLAIQKSKVDFYTNARKIAQNFPELVNS